MILLHIAPISDRPFSGLCVVVPQHVIAHQHCETVGFINTTNLKLDNIENQFEYKTPFELADLPEPFSKPDLVVFHSCYIPEYLGIVKELKKNNVPYIIVPHGCFTEGAQRKKHLKKKIGNLLFFNKYIYGAKSVQCLSESEFNATKLVENKFIATNGINLSDKKKTSFSKEGVKLLYIGRLDPFHKGLDLMLEAVKSCLDFLKIHNANISIYGPDIDGDYEKVKTLIYEKGVEDIVTLNGALYGEEKTEVLLDADVFIQTSRFEGMPMGILEALEYGLPCLATYETTLGKMIEEYNAGWACSASADDISKALKKAVEEKELYMQKSESAVSLVKENFTWDKISENTLEKYREILRG